jgi:hypothetical protein
MPGMVEHVAVQYMYIYISVCMPGMVVRTFPILAGKLLLLANSALEHPPPPTGRQL